MTKSQEEKVIQNSGNQGVNVLNSLVGDISTGNYTIFNVSVNINFVVPSKNQISLSNDKNQEYTRIYQLLKTWKDGEARRFQLWQETKSEPFLDFIKSQLQSGARQITIQLIPDKKNRSE